MLENVVKRWDLVTLTYASLKPLLVLFSYFLILFFTYVYLPLGTFLFYYRSLFFEIPRFISCLSKQIVSFMYQILCYVILVFFPSLFFSDLYSASSCRLTFLCSRRPFPLDSSYLRGMVVSG